MMSSNTNPINELPNQLKSYLNNKIDLLSLFLVKKVGQFIPLMIVGFIIAFTLLFFTLFFSYSFIQWYQDYIGKASTASLIVSGFYLLLSLIVYIFRKPLIYRPIQKGITKNLNFKDIHKTSSIKNVNSFEDLDIEIERISKLSEEDDKNIDNNIDEIKAFYSFESIKARFFDDILQNPKPAISLILQSIMSITSLRKRIKERKSSKE